MPWSRLRAVERYGGELGIDWEPDGGATVGPFAAGPGSPPDHADEDHSEDHLQDDRAEQLGAAALLLRDRSLAAGSPGNDTTTGPGPGWLVLVTYIVLIGVAVLTT